MHIQTQPLPAIKSNGSAVGNALEAKFRQIWADQEAEERKWCNWLYVYYRVQAATPDDGWVDRKENYVIFPTYRRFFDKPVVGSLIALGTAPNYRLCRVTKIVPSSFADITRYYFNEITHHRPAMPERWEIHQDFAHNRLVAKVLA